MIHNFLMWLVFIPIFSRSFHFIKFKTKQKWTVHHYYYSMYIFQDFTNIYQTSITGQSFLSQFTLRFAHAALQKWMKLKWTSYTEEPGYNEQLGGIEITLLYQGSHFIRAKKQWDTKMQGPQNHLVITSGTSL